MQLMPIVSRCGAPGLVAANDPFGSVAPLLQVLRVQVSRIANPGHRASLGPDRPVTHHPDRVILGA